MAETWDEHDREMMLRALMYRDAYDLLWGRRKNVHLQPPDPPPKRLTVTAHEQVNPVVKPPSQPILDHPPAHPRDHQDGAKG